MAGKRPRVSQSRPRRNGNGHALDGDTSPDHLTDIDRMLDILTSQTAELERLAALTAKDTSSTVKTPRKANDTFPRNREKRN